MAPRAARRRTKLWRIQGFDGLTKIYESHVPLAQLSDERVRALLMTLVARAGLTYDEIVEAYSLKRRNTRRPSIANTLLKVQRDGLRSRFTCGKNPFFVASIVEKEGL